MPNLILGFDTETNGMVDWKNPSGGEQQPHIVQIAALLADTDTREVIQSVDLIIRPDGWTVPEDMTEIHGITTEYAMDVGVPEKQALEIFLDLWNGRPRVAHNRTFDQRIIRIALKRYGDEVTTEQWADKETFDCTMLAANKIMKTGKMPTLAEAYEYFVGEPMEGAHTAIADAEACMKIYWEMQDKS